MVQFSFVYALKWLEAKPLLVFSRKLYCRVKSNSLFTLLFLILSLFITLVQVEKLQELLKPMMLRRLKGDVEKSLAPKQETIIEVELTSIQKKYYR